MMDHDVFDENLEAALAYYEDGEYLDVREFHTKFNQVVGTSPQFLSQRLAFERADFLQEELNELRTAIAEGDMAGIADALVDIVYVAKGTGVMMGLPWRELWDDVQRANLAKIPGTTHRGVSHDVCKPKGWVGPKTLEVLRKVGYDPANVLRDVDYLDSGITPYRGPLAAQQGMTCSVSSFPEDPTIYPENPIGGLER